MPLEIVVDTKGRMDCEAILQHFEGSIPYRNTLRYGPAGDIDPLEGLKFCMKRKRL